MMLVTLGAAVFVGLGLFLVIYDSPRFGLKAAIAGWASIGFFGLCGAYASTRAFRPGAAVVLNPQGLLDNSSGFAAGLIPWGEIRAVEYVSFQGQDFVGVILSNVDAYIQRLGPIKSRAARWNLNNGLPAVLIPQISIEMDVHVLAKKINEYRAAREPV